MRIGVTVIRSISSPKLISVVANAHVLGGVSTTLNLSGEFYHSQFASCIDAERCSLCPARIGDAILQPDMCKSASHSAVYSRLIGMLASNNVRPPASSES